MALNANPNAAHFALAELARKRPNFVTLTQNVDGSCPSTQVISISFADMAVKGSVKGLLTRPRNYTCYMARFSTCAAPSSTAIIPRKTTSRIPSSQR